MLALLAGGVAVLAGRRGVTVGLAAAAATMPAIPHAASARAPCANRDVPFEAAPALVREALLCEIARARDRQGVRRFRLRAELDLAALRHAADMRERRYFAHVSPGGGQLGDRARRAGYSRRGCSWRVGEVLAWGTGSRSTAAASVRAWLRSPSHRRILLSRRYADVGAGMVGGTPFERYASGVTVAAMLGRRLCAP
jgi:uncharacterized protein YkwD